MRKVFLFTAALIASLMLTSCGPDEVIAERAESAPDDITDYASENIAVSSDDRQVVINTWPGTQPAGVTLLDDVTIMGRGGLGLPLDRECTLSKGSNFQLGNNARGMANEVFYYAITTARPLTVTAPFDIFNPVIKADGTKERLKITPQDEVLIWALEDENWVQFTKNDVRHEGPREDFSPHSNFENLVDDLKASEQLWLGLRCDNGRKVLLSFDEVLAHPDITKTPKDPMRRPADFTDEEIAAIRADME